MLENIRHIICLKSVDKDILENKGEDKIKREIFVLCQNKLIKYSVPKVIEIIDEMPRTNFGKIDFIKFE